jgi:hypothetical protein
MRRSCIISIVLLVGTACTAKEATPSTMEAAPSTDAGGGTDGGVTPGTSMTPSDSGPPAPAGPPTFCGVVPGQGRAFATEDDFVALVARRWQTCSPGFASVPGQAGLELGRDRTFRVLVRDAAGALVPTTSPDGVGTFTLVQGPRAPSPGAGSLVQLEFDAQSGAQYGQLMALVTDSPRAMRLIGFVPESTDGWTENEVTQPSAGAPSAPPPACTARAGTVLDAALEASTPADAGVGGDAGDDSDALVGDWLFCGGEPLGLRTDYAGIRFDARGRYASLVRDSSGALAVATDLFDSGGYTFGSTPGALALQYGVYSAYTGTLDAAQLPDRLALTATGGTATSVFVRRSRTGL